MEMTEKRLENMIYIIKGPQFTHKRHLNQLRKRLTDEADGECLEEIVMEVIYNTFDITTPLAAPEMHRSMRKKESN